MLSWEYLSAQVLYHHWVNHLWLRMKKKKLPTILASLIFYRWALITNWFPRKRKNMSSHSVWFRLLFLHLPKGCKIESPIFYCAEPKKYKLTKGCKIESPIFYCAEPKKYKLTKMVFICSHGLVWKRLLMWSSLHLHPSLFQLFHQMSMLSSSYLPTIVDLSPETTNWEVL